MIKFKYDCFGQEVYFAFRTSNKFRLCFEVKNDLVTSIVIRPTASTIVNQECYNLRTDLRVITK